MKAQQGENIKRSIFSYEVISNKNKGHFEALSYLLHTLQKIRFFFAGQLEFSEKRIH